MTKSEPKSKVDFFFDKAERWRAEFKKLRMIILDRLLTEELKWGVPSIQDVILTLSYSR